LKNYRYAINAMGIFILAIIVCKNTYDNKGKEMNNNDQSINELRPYENSAHRFITKDHIGWQCNYCECGGS